MTTSNDASQSDDVERDRREFPTRSSPIRSSIGFDFAAAVAGLTLLGWAFDRFQGTEPWGLLTGACLGIVGGLYNSLKAAGVIGRRRKGGSTQRDHEDGG